LSAIKENRYKQLLEQIFFDSSFGAYEPGLEQILFTRPDIERAAADLKIKLPKNVGDVVYNTRYRNAMPRRIIDTQPAGKEWIIEGDGRARYKFALVQINRIVPNRELAIIKIPDATPDIIGAYALNDEQALLARVRYNRLIDVFLGVTAYSLQSHMRTSVSGIGQIEIDEVYVAIDRKGIQYVIPVQAKGGKDQLSVVQTKQDLACCAEKFSNLVCRTVSAQFMDDDLMAMFELTMQDGRVCVVDEKHYRLVQADNITAEELRTYRSR
jgi:hypothetical protein